MYQEGTMDMDLSQTFPGSRLGPKHIGLLGSILRVEYR